MEDIKEAVQVGIVATLAFTLVGSFLGLLVFGFIVFAQQFGAGGVAIYLILVCFVVMTISAYLTMDRRK